MSEDTSPDPQPTEGETGTDTPSDPAEAIRAEFAEIAAIAAQAARLGVTVDAAAALAQGIGADALRRSVLEALATRAEATAVVSTAPTAPATGDSPIIRRARQRAAQNP